MSNIDIQYPLWFILLCAGLGLLVTFVLYFRNAKMSDKSPLAVWGLGFLRFLSVTFLAILLLSPVLKEKKEELEKPIVVLAADQSASIASEMDSNALQSFQNQWDQSIKSLQEKFEVVPLGFGSQVTSLDSWTHADASSNISAVLEHVGDLYGDRNLGAVILATDGIYNEGKDPRYADFSISAPIYTVALGDTTPDRDLIIRQVYSNNIAYLGDRTAIQIDLGAYNFDRRSVTLSVSKVDGDGSQVLDQKTARISGLDYFETFEFDLAQDQVGLQQFRVSVTSLDGEKTYRNNRKDFFIDVIDARQKIIILYDHVHPDVAALKASLEENKNYQVVTSKYKSFKGHIEEFDVVLLHQLPANRTNVAPFIARLDELKKPRIFFIGSNSNARLFSSAQGLVKYVPKNRSTNDVQAVVNRAFSFFTIPEDLELKLGQFAPVQAPFADYSVGPSAEVLLSQRIGRVDTEFPLFAFDDQNDIKTAVFCAEGIWRWRLYDYLQHDNHDLFDALLSKTLQFVSVKEDKRKFRVYQSEKLISENEEGYFEAELYNQSYELINDPDVTLSVINSEGASFDYVFSKRNRGYSLNVGRFPAGNYRWKAQCTHDNESHEAEGRFSVQEIQKESYATVADHNLLAGVASGSNGRLVGPQDLDQLTAELLSGDQLKPVYYQVIKTRSAIHLKWIFFSLALIMVLEWLGRRLLGTY